MYNLRYLFFSFDGRISRREFWMGVAGLVVLGLVVGFVLMPLLGLSALSLGGPIDFENATDAQMLAFMEAQVSRMAWGGLITLAVFAWPALALMVKRAHDRGRVGMLAYAYFVILFALYAFQALGAMFVVGKVGGVPMPIPTPLAGLLYAVAGVVSLILLVNLGFLKGTPGSNPYGVHPRDRV